MSLYDLPRLVQLESQLPVVGGWKLKHKEIEPAANAFSVNHDRVHALLLQTPTMLFSSSIHTQVWRDARWSAYGTGEPSPEQITPEKEAEEYEYARTLGDKFNADRMANLTNHVQYMVDWGVSKFEELIDGYKDQGDICKGVEAMISSALILSCTAVEVVYADVCRVVGEAMGHPSLGFASLKTARTSFGKVFANDPTVMGVFNRSHFDALAQVRHLLVHRGGAVDQMYLDKLAKNPLPQLPPLSLNDKFPMNGILANDLIRDAIHSAGDLVKAVDDWLDTHPLPP